MAKRCMGTSAYLEGTMAGFRFSQRHGRCSRQWPYQALHAISFADGYLRARDDRIGAKLDRAAIRMRRELGLPTRQADFACYSQGLRAGAQRWMAAAGCGK